MKTLFVALRAILYGACFVLFWGWLARAARRYDERLGLAAPAWWEPVGVALMVPGTLIVFACVGTFVAFGQGTPAPFDPPTAFVPSGPYRYVRNPMYIGAALFLAGYGLFEGSPATVLLSLIFLITFHLFVLFVEEPALERRFGETYVAYKRSVHRWIPRLPPRSA